MTLPSASRFASLLAPTQFNTAALRSEMLGKSLWPWDGAADIDPQKYIHDKHILIGIPDDRGVALNSGHLGASGGPDSFRQSFYRLYDVRLAQGPWAGSQWSDFGDVKLLASIADTHSALAEVVSYLLAQGARRVHVIGGGHDFSFGSYLGHSRSCSGVVPILNFDAHFDLRPMEQGEINSGTPFRRVIETLGDRVDLGRAIFEIGIQRERNPQSLWDFAQTHGVSVAEYTAGQSAWRFWNSPVKNPTEKCTLEEHLRAWLNLQLSQSTFSGHLHASIDLDVFAVAAAMGTSASTSFGVPVETLWPCVEDVLSRKICRVVDVAELCPARDSQMQTARLAAALVFRGALSLDMLVR